MSVEFSALQEKPPTCIPKGYTSEASGPLLFRRSSSLFERAKKKGIRAWMSRSGDFIQSMRRNRFVVEQTQSIKYIYMFASIQEIGPEASKVWWVPATFTC
jgi:hypothetical protein